jgi:hypothetical protein
LNSVQEKQGSGKTWLPKKKKTDHPCLVKLKDKQQDKFDKYTHQTTKGTEHIQEDERKMDENQKRSEPPPFLSLSRSLSLPLADHSGLPLLFRPVFGRKGLKVDQIVQLCFELVFQVECASII